MRAPLLALLLVLFPLSAGAQELVEDRVETMKARVVEVVSAERRVVPGTDTQTTYQTIRAEVLEGAQKGAIVGVEHDYLTLRKGEVFYLSHITTAPDGYEFYAVGDPYRLPMLGFLALLFLIVVVVFGGRQGLRGLAALSGSILLVALLLLPGVLHGYSPVLVAIGVSSVIIVLGSYVTHGFTRTTSAAVLGMIATISLTGVLASLSVSWVRLSGLASDESVYLNMNMRGELDTAGLLLAGILIGLLGVLYDAAIGQAVSVEELHRVAPHVPRATIYARAIRIGREHIGALVNTLAIAYVGAALPLLLLFYSAGTSGFLRTVNQELFATEIVRTLVGSIGLVLAVPITTLIAVAMLVSTKPAASAEALAAEQRALSEARHTH